MVREASFSAKNVRVLSLDSPSSWLSGSSFEYIHTLISWINLKITSIYSCTDRHNDSETLTLVYSASETAAEQRQILESYEVLYIRQKHFNLVIDMVSLY